MAEEKELWQELHDAIGNVFREKIKKHGKDDFAFQAVAAYEELNHLTCEYVNSAVSRFEEFMPKLQDKDASRENTFTLMSRCGIATVK